MRAGIWWIRRDLRLHDNPALRVAAGEGATIPLFIFDPHLQSGGRLHTPLGAFLREGLRTLDAALRARRSRLVIRSGRPRDVLEQLVRETGAAVIVATEDVSPYARRRDAEVAACLPLRLVGGPLVLPPDLTTRPDGAPYLIYGAFRRAWLERVSLDTLATLPLPTSIATPAATDGERHPSGVAAPAEFPPSEDEARRRLQTFTRGTDAGVYRYARTRDRLDVEGTSRLSPYLRAGMLSPREVALAALRAVAEAPDAEARRSAQRWLDELIWREFYTVLLFHRPMLRTVSLRPRLRHFPWINSVEDFAAWTEGRTGYPVVDAGMRQLRTAGWISNRVRMIVASFLTKHLLTDWRWGARHFMQCLVDGDPAANNGGWQWVAGTGTAAAPYFRIFNPTQQGRTWDPEGKYVRQWVPELARVPAQYIHAPWTMPREVQRQSGCVVGVDYPAPVVDQAAARRRALALSRGILTARGEAALR